MPASDFEIRSFRSVFALERRVYQLDNFRLNPGGIPLRGIVYAIAIELAVLIAGTLPVLSWPLGAVPWYLSELALPLALAGLLTVVRIEGRPFHVALGAIARSRVGPRHLVGLQPAFAPTRIWMPPPITYIADGSEAVPHRLRYRGPGVALICFAHDRAEWTSALGVRPHADISIHPIAGMSAVAPTALELAPGALLVVAAGPLRRAGARRS
jgi:hypothetical protein